MPELLATLDAFMQEHRRCGVMDSGVDGGRVWMACDCGTSIAHPVTPAEPTSGRRLTTTGCVPRGPAFARSGA